ncbi:uncharacterized protein [Acropora muricata]|uniref:uncharacterized protein n=1 Tax=Acropora muricata TaxID=159855 RepID=UPI0034E4BA91
MNQEFIFVQTDPAFNVVLYCLKELGDQNRLQVTHYQWAHLTNIESNDDDEDRRFMFGGENLPPNHAFGRTASAIVRMCMLEAAGVPKKLWPLPDKNAAKRNKAKLHKSFGISLLGFCLASTKKITTHYLSKYDQLYPHFRIEDKVDEVDLDTPVSIPSMMLIFRGNFTEVVEITTTFKATAKGNQQFESYIHVTCIVREISTKEGNDGRFTQLLKELMHMVPVEVQEKYFEDMTKVKAKEDLPDLCDAFARLEVRDTNE